MSVGTTGLKTKFECLCHHCFSVVGRSEGTDRRSKGTFDTE